MWETPISLLTLIGFFSILAFLMFSFVFYFNLGFLIWTIWSFGKTVADSVITSMKRKQIKFGKDFPE